ncbi:MAG: hypothetical protein KIH64_004710 [Mycobacterium sp.]|nr:hypothetical protein [Mycobacterium sp.]
MAAAAVLAAAGMFATLNAAGARADTPDDFKTPSGNIYCDMGTNGDGVPIVACEGGGPQDGPKPACAANMAWGDRFYLAQGQPPRSDCHTDTIRSNEPQAPVLEYGQTKSNGTITCDSETTGLTCTDTSTGRFFSMSREANVLG